MTYAIGYFVFGVSLADVPEKFSDVVNELHEAEVAESYYSGSGDPAPFIGVEVDQIDECSELGWKEISETKDLLKAAMEPNSKERKAFVEKLKALEEFTNDGMEDCEEEDIVGFVEWVKKQTPEVFLTWGSS